MIDYTELRAALEIGPTPGPWKANTSGEIGPISREDDQSFGMILPVAFAEFENSEANRRYIAACHPEAIRALLADHDNWRRQAVYETEVAQAAIERVKSIETERDALRDALENLLSVREGKGGTKYPADDLARDALAHCNLRS